MANSLWLLNRIRVSHQALKVAWGSSILFRESSISNHPIRLFKTQRKQVQISVYECCEQVTFESRLFVVFAIPRKDFGDLH